ncbi:ATP-grasp domain-containing protein [Chromobacterium vaccinii]|uniref:ATP-grasp domain-containing protein n=1 Tax=Chromobacterium vaccinii TaxID=1108595 RepID=UPI0031D5CF8C
MKRAIILLSHCGYSFMEDLTAAARRQGQAVLILSSAPLGAASERLDALAGLADSVRAAAGHQLEEADLLQAIDAWRGQGWEPAACVSVWEGYRRLMAQANALLGVPDLAPDTVDNLTDKHWLRQRLQALGLSQTRTELASDASLETWLSAGRPGFVKPRRGLASFGASKLRPGLNMARLSEIGEEASRDPLYAGLIGNPQFIIEDYLDGPEFSFEVMMQAGRAYLLGVHHKLQVTEQEHTVLEECCVSPPLDWEPSQADGARQWLQAVLHGCGADWGCFHLEARLCASGWELIEINPRVGGSLISPSVAVQCDGRNLLDFWLKQLLAADFGQQLQAGSELAALDSEYPRRRASFFRAYFCRPGTIDSIERNEHPHAPDQLQCFLQSGQTITEGAREVFLGQALWSFDYQSRHEVIPELLRASSRTLVAHYAD